VLHGVDLASDATSSIDVRVASWATNPYGWADDVDTPTLVDVVSIEVGWHTAGKATVS
jgi:hypothetical protein